MINVVSHALCMYREAKGTEANKLYSEFLEMTKVAEPHTQEYKYEIAVKMDKVLNAVKASNAAHDELKTNVENFCVDGIFHVELNDGKTFMSIMENKFKNVIDEAYEYFENKMEDAALSKFHYDAYGRDD